MAKVAPERINPAGLDVAKPMVFPVFPPSVALNVTTFPAAAAFTPSA